MTLLDDFKQFVADAEAGTQFSKWGHDNPGDLARWRIVRDAILTGGRPPLPTMLTAHGRELVDAARVYLDATQPPAPPQESPDNTIVLSGSPGAIVDAAGHRWTITGDKVAVDGVVDAITSNVTRLMYEAGKVWQENTSGFYWFKTKPGDTWAPSGGTNVSPVPGETPPPPRLRVTVTGQARQGSKLTGAIA